MSNSKTVFNIILLVITLIFGGLCHSEPQPTLTLSDKQALSIGQKIWHNEGLGKIEYLTTWNQGEDFPSLGIGHFIWYPVNTEKTFIEQFPQFILFLIKSDVEIPPWLMPPTTLPWTDRNSFYAHYDSKQMAELRKLLSETIPQQVEFIIARMKLSLPKMLASIPAHRRAEIQSRFHLIAAQPNGAYALIDYVNFKGEGTEINERYKNIGWGLLQVLDNLDTNNSDIMSAFANAADYVLTRRVENAPRDESKWLRGWRKRIKTYQTP